MEEAIDSMAQKLHKLFLHEKSAVSIEKLEPDYVLHLDAQSSQKRGPAAYLAATSSNYSIRLYSRLNLANIQTITAHEKPISGVKFSHCDPNMLYSASQDGTIRKWDLRTSMNNPIDTFEGNEDTHNVFTAFDIGSNDRLLCAGTEANKDGDSHIIFWDCRGSRPLVVYSDSHQDDVTQVHFHPDLPDKMITAATDGLVNMFDVSQDSEDDALLTSFNAECAINKIGWCGRNKERAFCLTTIETLHIYDTTGDFDTIAEIKDIRETYSWYKGDEMKKVDYIVDCFQPDDSDPLMVVLGDKEGQLNLAVLEGSELNHCHTLDTAHSDIVRCLTYDRSSRTVVTGGEDAMLCLWSPHPPTQTGASASSHLKVKAKSKMSGKGKRKSKSKPF